jgi:hypothetical protein
MMTAFAIVASVLTLAAPEPRLEDLESTVSSMETAVLAGDAVSYLAEVNHFDPVFLMEQTNWAGDLAEHTPVAFDIMLDGDSFKAHADGSVTVPMTIAWRMSDKAKRRKVAFKARFVDRKGHWRFAGEVWMRVEAPGVVVLSDPKFKDEALHIAALLPGVRDRVHEILGVEVEADQQVKVYAKMRHLQESIFLSYTDSLGGWNEPGEAIKLLGREGQSGRALRSLLAHEYGHAASFALGGKAIDMPWWVLEGVAEYCSSEIAGGGSGLDARIRRWAEADNLRDWDQLADFRGEAMNHQAHVYGQGHHMIQYLVDVYGIEQVRAWLRFLAGGASLDEASKFTLEKSWAEIDAAWRASIGDE